MPTQPPFGPNTALVQRFVDRLAELDLADFAEVVQTWRARLRRTDAWCIAEDAVGDAIARTRRDGEMWVLQDRIYAVFRAAPWYIERPNDMPAPAEVASQYLTNTAAVALLVVDALPARHFTTLYAPFAPVISLGDIAWTGRRIVERVSDGFDASSGDAGRWIH